MLSEEKIAMRPSEILDAWEQLSSQAGFRTDECLHDVKGHVNCNGGDPPREGIDLCDDSIGSLVSLSDSHCSSLISQFSGDELFDYRDAGISKCTIEIDGALLTREQSSRTRGIATQPNLSSPTSKWNNFDIEEMDIEPLRIISSVPKRGFSSVSRTVEKEATFDLFPDDILYEFLSYLDVHSLCKMREVSKRYKEQASKDEAGWARHCSQLWKNKVHISWKAQKARESRCSLSAFHLSLNDGQSRHEITPTELCFDPCSGSGTVWHFRFKESAGSAWTSFDPWHAGNECRKMVFLRNGEMKEFVPNSSSTASYRLVEPFTDAPSYHHADPLDAEAASISMKWRFLLTPMDMPSRARGAYIRLNIGGRDVPTYIVQRSPTNNWGFIIENCWGVFASFPLPPKTETARGPPMRPTRMRLRRTSNGGVRWLNVDGIESDSDEDDMEIDDMASSVDGRLLGDRALPTTRRRQWREALLYNYGSVTLPEGEAARTEFDRIFESFRSPIRSLNNIMR